MTTHDDIDHDRHDCFIAAQESYERIRNTSASPTGFYIFVSDCDGDDNDYHGRLNTAFATLVFRNLVATTLKGHTPGCPRCNAVAQALRAAREAFETTLAGRDKGSCR